MRGLIVAGAGCLLLAGCNPETATTTTPAAEESAFVAPLDPSSEADEPPPPVDCTQINAVFAAFNEPVPFASLATGPAISPANAACKVGEAEGAVPGSPRIHALACTLYSSGALDRENNAVPAKAAFVEARRQVEACLPAKWTMRDGAVAATNANEAMIYESEEDAQRAMTGAPYVYPVQLKKAWVESAAGEPGGWRVTLDFQKEAGRQ